LNRLALSLLPKAALSVALATLATAAVGQTTTPPAQTADSPRYRTYDELTASLRALGQTNAGLVKLVDLGKSHEGRSVWAVEVASGAGADTRPALLVAANFEGNQVIGSELALALAKHLASSYATDAAVKKLLNEHAVYIIPRANPDGAELMFGKVKSFRRTNARKVDDDNDGRVDEDGPEDLNGDGFISMMRVKDPKGPYMVHPDDARLLRRADASKGEAGGWSVYWEGTDNDGDGFINEDGPGGVDLNRNFQHRYPYYTPDAGPHMVSEPETRAVMDYILKKKNVAMILTYGASDNLITAPTRAGALAPAQSLDLLTFAEQSLADARKAGTFAAPNEGQFFFGGGGGGGFGGGGQAPPQTRPPGQPAPRPPSVVVAPADVEYFRTVSDKYRTLTGVRNAAVTRAPAGAFFEYGYYQFGVPSFSTPGWGLSTAAPATPAGGATPPPATGAATAGGPPGGGFGGGRGGGGQGGPGGPGGAGGGAGQGGAEEPTGTAVFDVRVAKAIANSVIAWAPYTHPTLGAVEIGGFKPYVATNPEASEIEALGKSHAAFAVYLGSLFPKIAIADLTAAPLGGGLYRIKAEVENVGYLPTSTAHGVTSQSVKPVMVQIGVPPESLISGDAKTSFIPALAGSGRRQSYQWIVRGKAGQSIAVKAVAEKGGSAEKTVTLQPLPTSSTESQPVDGRRVVRLGASQ
jgi:hypothetical protein